MPRKRICIVRARRTPQGRFLGALSKYTPEDLGVAAGEAALAGIDPCLVDLVIVGRVLPPDLNVARVISRRLNIPNEKTAFTINMACASGMKAVQLGADAIQLGQAQVVLAGGTESMTNTPHMLEGSRQGKTLGDAKLADCLLMGLSDALLNEHMGATAQRLADQFNIDRATQDKFAYDSHMKAISAQQRGAFDDEIIALAELAKDEHPRSDTTPEKLAALKPAFAKDGSVTAGNASGINDGAAMLLLCDESTAQQHGWQPMCFLGDALQVGCDPATMGIGPAYAFKHICEKSSTSLNDFDTLEINEAFASQTLACLRELGLPDNEPRLNCDGGAIGMGHPVGASGARLIVHMAHRIQQGLSSLALAGLCVSGGMGIASVISKEPT